jgi:hypothetical protein
MVASVYGQIQFPPANVLMFRPDDTGDADAGQLVAAGSLQAVDPNRLLIKRVVLVGSATPFTEGVHCLPSSVARFEAPS